MYYQSESFERIGCIYFLPNNCEKIFLLFSSFVMNAIVWWLPDTCSEEINEKKIDKLNPMGPGCPLFPSGEIYPLPLSEIPENVRLTLKLWVYSNIGLKLQKNPNQFHMNLVSVESYSFGAIPVLSRFI